MKTYAIGAVALGLVAATASAAAAQPRPYDQYTQQYQYQRPQYQQPQYQQPQYQQRQYEQRQYERRDDENRGYQGDGRYQQSRHHGWGEDRGDQYQWRRGQRMGYNDWNNARPFDYRSRHLRQPPRGYEWRESNGQYVLGALATGLIISTILSQR